MLISVIAEVILLVIGQVIIQSLEIELLTAWNPNEV